MTRKGWENRPAAWDPTEGPTAESFSPNHNQGLETKPSPTLNMFLIEKLDVKFLSLIFSCKKWAQWRWKLLFAQLCTWRIHTFFSESMPSWRRLGTQTPIPACCVSKGYQLPLLTDQQVAGNGLRAVTSLSTMGTANTYTWHMCWYLHNVAVPEMVPPLWKTSPVSSSLSHSFHTPSISNVGMV